MKGGGIQESEICFSFWVIDEKGVGFGFLF